ncbi:MAG: MFS transporter, partial [Phycisphaerales bacterium]
NLKHVLIALFGAAAGQGVVWYTGQFYALFFLQKTANVELVQSNIIIGVALLVATPFFVVMGSLSDKVGRKPLIMLGCLLAVLTYIPLFKGIYAQADLSRKSPVSEVATPLGTPTVRTLDRDDPSLKAQTGDVVTVAKSTLAYTDGSVVTETKTTIDRATTRVSETVAREVKLGGGPMLITMGLVCILVTYVTMVYGPIAALLVEMFPTRIRYTSMSLPYHIGNGVFGGLVPFAATWISNYTIREFPGSSMKLYAGLLYPMAIAFLTLVVGSIFIKERRGIKMWDESMDGRA